MVFSFKSFAFRQDLGLKLFIILQAIYVGPMQSLTFKTQIGNLYGGNTNCRVKVEVRKFALDIK